MQGFSLEEIPQVSERPEAAREFFFEKGYYVELRNGFTAEECDRLVDEAKTFDNFKNETFAPLMMPHRQSDVFLKAMKNEKIVNLVKHFLGSDVKGMQSEFFFCRPGTMGFANHQDNYFVEAENGGMISAWTPLVDVTKELGCLRIYPGSHKLGLLPIRKIENFVTDAGQDPNANNQECVISEASPYFDLELPRGAILFIHSLIVHASNKNLTDNFRYVLLNTYLKDGIKFRPGRYANRTPVDLSC